MMMMRIAEVSTMTNLTYKTLNASQHSYLLLLFDIGRKLLKQFSLLNSIISSSLMSAQTLVKELLLTQHQTFGATSLLKSNPLQYLSMFPVRLISACIISPTGTKLQA